METVVRSVKKQSYPYWQLQCTAITITNLLLMCFQWWQFILNMLRFLNNDSKPSQLNFNAFRHILFSSVCRMSLEETFLMWSPQAQKAYPSTVEIFDLGGAANQEKVEEAQTACFRTQEWMN